MAFQFSRWGNDLYTGKRSYKVVPRYRVWFIAAVCVAIACGILLFAPGLRLGIEFAGGNEYRVSGIEGSVSQQVAIDQVQRIVGGTEVPKVTNLGADGVRVQTSALSLEVAEELHQALAEAYGVPPESVSVQEVGATWGAGVFSKAVRGSILFLALVAVAMMLYFRNWAMSVSAIVALLHDLVVTVGIYAAVGFEVTPATLIGFLTVLGYSMYDTVVVFDKVRENTANVLDQSQFTYGEAANLAVNQTMVRSINTSVVAILPVASILFVGAFMLGAGTLQDISLALFVGMAIGTYSSIFLATPLEVWLRHREPKISAHTKKVLDLRATRIAAGDGDDTAAEALTTIGALRAGGHQGQIAQPRRKPRSER
ncbi:MAG: protein translocase subunit SecF [Micrococcales bacterium]|nr:protein translocase subunit SecF [Micrococcales bacterium]